MSDADPQPKQRLLPNLLLAVTVSLVFAGGLEGLARLLEARTPPAPPVKDYIWDWQKKWDGDFYTIRSDGIGWPPWEQFNGDGVRDRTHAVEKPEGVARVMCLGDSVTLGDGIAPRQAFPQVLEERLDERGPGVEVFNLALWGWSTRQERIAYRRLGRKYRPDEVVLAVCLNDIPELQNNLSRPPRLLALLYARSALVRRLVDARGREIRSVEDLFRSPESPSVRQGFERFFEEVEALRSEVAADGGRLAIAVFPFRFQVEPGAPAPSAEKRILEFGARKQISVLDLLPALARLGPAAFGDYDHLSPAGARATAEALAAWPALPQPLDGAAILARALGRTPPEVPALAAALTRPEVPVRRAAAWALAHHGREAAGARPALTAALGSDPEASVRAEAARALGALGRAGRAASPALLAALRDPRAQVRWAAARALAQVGLDAGDVPALTAALGSDDVFVRGFAAWGLGELGPAAREAVPALTAALDREEAYGRAGAAMALARIGPAAAPAVPALARGLASPDPERRWKAARALGHLGPSAAGAVSALSAALSDPDERVRAQAARALGRVGSAATPAATALERASRDSQAVVRKEALEALRKISGG